METIRLVFDPSLLSSNILIGKIVIDGGGQGETFSVTNSYQERSF